VIPYYQRADGAATLWLTFSRTLWLALPVGGAVWLIGTFGYDRLRTLARSPLGRAWLVALGVLIVALGVFQAPKMVSRFSSRLGLDQRYYIWEANFDFLKKRPLSGIGFRHNQDLGGHYQIAKNLSGWLLEQRVEYIHSTNREQYCAEHYEELCSTANRGACWVFRAHAHNNLIQMLGGTGLFGALAWLGWCGLVFLILLRLPRGVGFAGGLFAAWVVFHLNGLTQMNFWEGKVLHSMMWAVAWGLCWSRREEVERGDADPA